MKFRPTKSVAFVLVMNLLVLCALIATRKSPAVSSASVPVAAPTSPATRDRGDQAATPDATPASVGARTTSLLAPTQTRRWVSERVRAWLPTDHERLWEKIGWTIGIQNALDRARVMNRPVLLFSYAGCIEGRL